MGKKDAITKEYVRRPEVFADAFNQFVYRGEQVVLPEKLKELDTAQTALPYGADATVVPEQRYRDALKLLTAMTDGERAFCILGIESQSDIHYAMPVKNGLYDFLQFAHQVAEAAKSHRAAAKAARSASVETAGKAARDSASVKVMQGDMQAETAGEGIREVAAAKPSSGEYLSGFWKTDRLMPVVTLVIYFGPEEWDAPLTLKEMYACEDEKLLAYAADYRVNLLAPGNLTNPEMELFRTDLREVMQYIKYSQDLQKITQVMKDNKRFRQMDRETAEVINAVTNSKLKFAEEEDTTDMCLAMDQLWENGIKEGQARGEAIGEARGEAIGEARGQARGQSIKLIGQLCRKLAKGKSPEAIAEDLEEDLSEIERIYEIAVKYAPDYDVEMIYAELSA